ncbi:MAG: hypothetical protein IIA09_18415 [Proteobacteria bacterium]|nr:hypothetical protein [Pseudomonadota bacterium]
MITIDSPSMALNDTRVSIIYQMDHNERIDPATSMRSIVDKIVAAARLEPLGRLQNLIINCHGFPGWVQLGTGLRRNTMAPFADIRGKVRKIWFQSCLVARIAGPHTRSHGDAEVLEQLNATSGNGHRFICSLARLTGCYIVAPTEIQGHRPIQYPRGQMDSYEGLVLSYNPRGAISWQHRYPSMYNINLNALTGTSPNNE